MSLTTNYTNSKVMLGENLNPTNVIVNSLTTQISYNAATDTPAISAMTLGQLYITATAGRVAESVIGATCTSGGSFLCVDDIISCTAASTYQLTTPIITVAPSTVAIGTLSNSSNIYFINLGEAISYINQRRISASAFWAVTFNSSYESTSYANPDSGTINFAHPNSSLISYIGNAVTVALSANTAASGAIQNQSVTYTAAANSLANSTWVTLYNETTSNAATTVYAGNHSGTWELTSGGGTTSLVLNNLGKYQVAFPSGGDTLFSGATLQTSTNVQAAFNFSGCNGLTVGNLIAVSNANAPILVCTCQIYLSSATAVLGIGSTSASTNTAAQSVIHDARIGIAPSGTVTSGGILSLAGGYSTNQQNQYYNSNINVAYLTTGFITTTLVSCNISVTTKLAGRLTPYASSIYAGNMYACNSTTTAIAPKQTQINIGILIANSCNTGGVICGNGAGGSISITTANINNTITGGGINLYGGTLNVGTLTTNSNAVQGLTIGGGVAYIATYAACNSNTYAGMQVTAGSLFINTLTSCVSNTVSSGVGLQVSGGSCWIGTVTSCINNNVADFYVTSGELQIVTDNSGATSATNHYLSDFGVIEIQGGTNAAGTGSVSTAGVGQIVKTAGTSPFNITNLPAATTTMQGAALLATTSSIYSATPSATTILPPSLSANPFTYNTSTTYNAIPWSTTQERVVATLSIAFGSAAASNIIALELNMIGTAEFINIVLVLSAAVNNTGKLSVLNYNSSTGTTSVSAFLSKFSFLLYYGTTGTNPVVLTMLNNSYTLASTGFGISIGVSGSGSLVNEGTSQIGVLKASYTGGLSGAYAITATLMTTQIQGTFTPGLSGWTNVGTPTVTGTWTFLTPNLIYVCIIIVPATTVSSTVLTSSITGLPQTVNPSFDGVLSVIDRTSGVGLLNATAVHNTTTINPPSISATADTIVIAGTYSLS